MNQNEERYTISEIAKMFDLPSSTLRYYEELGILPTVERTQSGQRIYTQCHIDRLGAICCFKRTGMSMSKLQTFFHYEENQNEHMDDMLQLLVQQEQEMEERLSQYRQDLQHVKTKVRFYQAKKSALENGQPQPCWDEFVGR